MSDNEVELAVELKLTEELDPAPLIVAEAVMLAETGASRTVVKDFLLSHSPYTNEHLAPYARVELELEVSALVFRIFKALEA